MKTLEEFLFTCDLCGASFRRGIGLSTHRRTRHFDKQGNIRQETLDLAKRSKPPADERPEAVERDIARAAEFPPPLPISQVGRDVPVEPEPSATEQKLAARINTIVNSIGYQLEFMFGFARGLVRTKFQNRCRRYLEENGTELPCSHMRRMMEEADVTLAVPLHCRKRYQMALDVCDLFEAMCNGAVEPEDALHQEAEESGVRDLPRGEVGSSEDAQEGGAGDLQRADEEESQEEVSA